MPTSYICFLYPEKAGSNTKETPHNLLLCKISYMDIRSCKLAVPNLKNKIIMTEFIMSTSLLILVAIAAAVKEKERHRSLPDKYVTMRLLTCSTTICCRKVTDAPST